MNDFTKDELKLIRYKLEQLSFSKFEGCYEINKKITSMIENYCEHKNTYEDLDYNPMRCKDCLELII